MYLVCFIHSCASLHIFYDFSSEILTLMVIIYGVPVSLCIVYFKCLPVEIVNMLCSVYQLCKKDVYLELLYIYEYY